MRDCVKTLKELEARGLSKGKEVEDSRIGHSQGFLCLGILRFGFCHVSNHNIFKFFEFFFCKRFC